MPSLFTWFTNLVNSLTIPLLISPIIENFDLFSLYLSNESPLGRGILTQFRFQLSMVDDANLFLNLLVSDGAPLASLGDICLDNLSAVYHYSIPTVKLAYPEPFVASASLMHGDLWFVHILIYQYWLWFIFVFIIVFFFITFICTVRWCNMRTRPRRETRGVSRSKCGDLITACVPVSWATSIIVNESTDAIDYFDGFGTSELVIGIRAYQWGWEYYYPKDLDLNFSLRNNFATMVGNSLKYESATDKTLKSSHMWKLYQGKPSDSVVNPISSLVHTDSFHTLNLLNFGETGLPAIVEATAFRKVRTVAKTASLIAGTPYLAPCPLNYKFLSDRGENELSLFGSSVYGLQRQISLLSKTSIGHQTLFDNEKVESFLIGSIQRGQSPQSPFLDSPLPWAGNPQFDTGRVSPLSLWNFLSSESRLENSNPSRRPLAEIFFTPLLTTDAPSSKPAPHLPSPNYSWVSHVATPFSPNLNFPLADKTIRHATQLLMNVANSNSIFTVGSILSPELRRGVKLNSDVVGNFVEVSPSETEVRLGMRNAFFDVTLNPSLISWGGHSLGDYDVSNSRMRGLVPIISQSKEEAIAPALQSAYWNSTFADSDQRWRLFNSQQLRKFENSQLTPLFNIFYDYDFRNWQALELLEDAIWEESSNTQYFDEYRENTSFASEIANRDKLTRLFEQFERKGGGATSARVELPKSPNFAIPAGLTDLNAAFSVQSCETRDVFQKNPPVFNDFYLRLNLRLLEDTTESVNLARLLLQLSSSQVKQIGSAHVSSFVMPMSIIFNSFRSDFDETSVMGSFAMVRDGIESNVLPFEMGGELETGCQVPRVIDGGKFVQMSEIFDRRNSVKSLIVSSNAIVKVFKNRYDDFRSLARLNDFSNMEAKQFFISNDRIGYETLLKKNNSPSLAMDIFKLKRNRFLTGESSDLPIHNSAVFDFPFLLALKSEAARYVWIDWFSKWNYVDVQPSSSSRYAIFGMPYFNKAFDFNTNENEIINDTETYFMRIARARKNYLPLWAFAPFLLSKSNFWFGESAFLLAGRQELELEMIQCALANARAAFPPLLQTLPKFQSNLVTPFNPTFSAIVLYTKSSPLSNETVNLYHSCLTVLSDILTKREFVIRAITTEGLCSGMKLRGFVNNPQNPLLLSLSNLFLYHDILNGKCNPETDLWRQGGLYRQFLTKGLFWGERNSAPSFESLLLKNQYRPLRKGVNNLLRLHATGAIAMPIEMRMQILASSKDVIHSWAIPSAGIKIDCVPGYSSHRVMIFLISGIFWGQCMEICGRYHHWMPIVVYFMKKDLFFLWCTHFVFFNPQTASFMLNSRQHESNLGLVTHDKFSWLTEMR